MTPPPTARITASCTDRVEKSQIPPPTRMTASCTDKVSELEQLEAGLPHFLDHVEKSQIASYVEAINRNIFKSNDSMTNGGSKRLLRKFSLRMRDSHEQLKRVRECLRQRYDANVEQRVALDRLVQGITASVNDQVEAIDDYLEEHLGEETMSQIDSHDSGLENLFTRCLESRRTQLDQHVRNPAVPQRHGNVDATGSPSYNELLAKRQPRNAAPETGDDFMGQHCQLTDPTQERVRDRLDAEEPIIKVTTEGDRDFEIRLRRLQDWEPQLLDSLQPGPFLKAEPDPQHRVDQRAGLPRQELVNAAARSASSDNANQAMQHLVACMEKISARSELPPPPVEHFDGNPAHYLFFAKNFEDRVGSGPFTDATKLSHLIEACSGQVKREVLDYKGQTNGYQRAMDHLEDNYGRPQQVVNAVIVELTQGRELTASNTRALKDFARKLETSYSLLEELEMTAEANTQANLKAIFARLPHRMRVRWAEKASDLEARKKPVDFKTLVEFVVEQTRRSCHPVFQITPDKQNDNQRDHDRNGSNARDRQRPRNNPNRQSGWSQPRNDRQPWNGIRNHTPPEFVYTNTFAQPPADPSMCQYPPPYLPQLSYYADPPPPPTGRGRGNPNTGSFPPPRPGADACKFCTRAHPFLDCPLFAASDPQVKRKFVLDNRLCFICLGEHFKPACKKEPRKCPMRGCTEEHHRLLHGVPLPNIPAREQAASIVNGVQASSVLLRIVPVKVLSKDGASLSTYAMLDGGSTCTFMRADIAKELGIRGAPHRMELNTISEEKSHDVEIGQCSLAPMNAPGEVVELHRVNIMKDFGIAYQPVRDHLNFSDWPHLNELPLKLPVDRPVVGLLIGEDMPLAHEIIENRYGADKPNEPYAARTRLGWYVAGPISVAEDTQVIAHVIKQEHEPQRSTSCCDLTSATEDLELTVRRLWNEERHGFASNATRTLSVEDKLDLERLNATVKLREDGHYTVGMLWKEPPQLPNNYAVARSCLEHVVKRMKDKPLFRDKYRETIEGYINDGHAVKLTDQEAWTSTDGTWYLPHHGVQNVNKPGKVRVVFNAASTYKGQSLNGQLSHGPDLNNSLAGTLLRFRKGPIAVNADIVSMFHMVYVPEEDSDALRFLWFEEGSTTPSVYKMRKHIFGAKDSPTACVFALQQCARDHAHLFDPIVSETVLNCFYTDDLLTAVDTEAAAIKLSEQITDMLELGGFKLEKFVSNSTAVLKALPQDRIAPACKELILDAEFNDLPPQRALGMRWDVPEDTFRTKYTDVEKSETRRGVLSFTAAIIDPLGLISPVVLVGRLILQDACRLLLDWDQPLPEDLAKRWRCWRKGLSSIHDLAIPRCYRGYENPSLIVNIQLHHFSDASENAYGVASYLRVELRNQQIACTLVFAKSRCKPLRHLSTPRLETQAAVCAVRCHTFVMMELKIVVHQTVFWTDSTIVLQYVRNTSKRFKSYIANRMEEIHDNSDPTMWRYCPTKSNPADAASRGLTAKRIINHPLWFKGPDFIHQPVSMWPTDPTTPVIAADDPEIFKDIIAMTEENQKPLLHDFLNYYSTWEDLVRHTCTLLKFVRYCRNDVNFTIYQSMSDCQQATEFIARVVQKQFFGEELDRLKNEQPVHVGSDIAKLAPVLTNELLRVGGRLQAMTMPFKNQHPIILPKASHNVTSALIRHVHATVGHCGPEHTIAKLRQTFWIIGGKGKVKDVLKNCMHCKKLYSRPMEQQMSPLPGVRLEPHKPPFNVTGADCFGPMMIKRGRSELKTYGIIFCCFSTRAVHLELMPDMTTDSLINAVRRFMSRRPRVSAIWCDNGSNLVGGSREIRRALVELDNTKMSRALMQEHVDWHFITPYAPHHAGVWERLVGSTKRTLKAVLQNQLPSRDNLHTALCEVERILNSRPITSASDDPSDLDALTPGHLLQQRIDSLPPGVFESADAYRRRWRQVQFLVNAWWSRWLKEYIPLLQSRSKWTRVRRNSAVGDLVLLVDQNAPRGHWQLGRVTTIYPSDDGLVRTVDVKTKTGVYRRPITKLCLLEGAPEEPTPKPTEDLLETSSPST